MKRIAKFRDKLKDQWNENPLAGVAVGIFAVTAVTKIARDVSGALAYRTYIEYAQDFKNRENCEHSQK